MRQVVIDFLSANIYRKYKECEISLKGFLKCLSQGGPSPTSGLHGVGGRSLYGLQIRCVYSIFQNETLRCEHTSTF